MSNNEMKPTFEVWRAQFGHVSGPYPAINETEKSFVFQGGRRRFKDSSWENYRRDKAECEEIAANYNIAKAAEKALRLKQSCAPELFEALETTYIALLNLPLVASEWRAMNQAIYCGLRDSIAKATGQDSEAVQNYYETKAYESRAQA